MRVTGHRALESLALASALVQCSAARSSVVEANASLDRQEEARAQRARSCEKIASMAALRDSLRDALARRAQVSYTTFLNETLALLHRVGLTY